MIAILGFLSWAVAAALPQSRPSANDAFVDALVFAPRAPIDATSLSPEMQARLDEHRRRFNAYTSRRPRSANSSELQFLAEVQYERRLVAVTDSPLAADLAQAYVDALRPCYEWEGFHDCPEQEAVFANEYRRTHPGGPFDDYLPLLAAHRWLCAAEGYEYEKRPDGAARSRQEYEKAIATARQSADLLIRAAADALAARGRCFSRR